MFRMFTVILAFALPAMVVPDAKADLEYLSKTLSFLPGWGVGRSRPDVGIWTDDMIAEHKQWQKAFDVAYPTESLIKLLKHDSPKVRTLAALLLFDRRDPKLLPHLVPLMKDMAASFPSPAPISNPIGFPKRERPPMEPQEVGKRVRYLVDEYLIHAGYRTEQFDDYWAKHKDRNFCASWFAVELGMASQHTTPTQPECVADIQKIRKRIDRIPEKDRFFTLVWLRDSPGFDALAKDDELIELGKKIGPEPLMLMLVGKMPSDDPDLQSRQTDNYQYVRMQRFVLDRAKVLLRAEDADKLLAFVQDVKTKPNNGLNHFWLIAITELQPKRAKEILTIAWEDAKGIYGYNADQRSHIAYEWWRKASDGDPAFVQKWFYEEKIQRGQFPHARSAFLNQLNGRDHPEDRKLLTKLVADKRFNDLDWQTLQTIVERLGDWDNKPLFTYDEIRKVWHPDGQGHYHWHKDEMKKKYPKETDDLEKELAKWRSAIVERLK